MTEDQFVASEAKRGITEDLARHAWRHVQRTKRPLPEQTIASLTSLLGGEQRAV